MFLRWAVGPGFPDASPLLCSLPASSGAGSERPCTQPSILFPKRHPDRRLQPEAPAAHEDVRLPLLPPGPDGIHESSLRRVRPSTPRARRLAHRSRTSGREFNPAIADCGFRAPLPPRLARPGTSNARSGKCAGGDERARTADLCLAKAALSQTELHPHRLPFHPFDCLLLAEREGFEPPGQFPTHAISSRAD